MQQYGWIVFALVVLGPLVGAVLLDRLNLGRTVSMAGLAVLIGGALALVLHGMNMATGTAARIGLEATSSPTPAPLAATSGREADARLTSDRINAERTSQELATLREQVASLGTERQRTADALRKAGAEVEQERAANTNSRQELAAVRGHLASLEALAAKSQPSLAKPQADLETEQAAHARTRSEMQGLREQIAGFEASKRKAAEAAAANVLAVLDTERNAHEKTRAALKAAEELAATHNGARKMLDGALRKADAELEALRSAESSQRAKPADARPVQTVAVVQPSEPPAALPTAPAPFSAVASAATTAPVASAVSTKPPAAATAPSAAPPADAKPAGEPAATAGAAASPRAAMDAGLTNPNFGLELVPSTELVQGQPGSYYRVICRDPAAAGKRFAFDAGGYSLTGGDTKVEPCFKALQTNVLGAVPTGLTKVVYVQGHATTQAFARPQKLDPVDTHLKALSFLPRTKDGRQFASKPDKLAVTATYLNKQLPMLRSGTISVVVSSATKGAVVPVLLEGEFKDAGDEASRSFDFILYVKW